MYELWGFLSLASMLQSPVPLLTEDWKTNRQFPLQVSAPYKPSVCSSCSFLEWYIHALFSYFVRYSKGAYASGHKGYFHRGVIIKQTFGHTAGLL